MHRMSLLGIVTVCAAIAACTSVQLESSTSALGPSINNLEQQQIYANLSMFIDSCAGDGACNAVPNQFVLGGGQAQVTNQLQFPNITANFQGLFVKSTGFQNQNQWTQSWAITPVTDYSDLERLRDLYQFAVSLSDSQKRCTALSTFVAKYTATQVKSVDPSNILVARYTGVTPLNNNGNQGITTDQIPIPLPTYDKNNTLLSDTSQWQHPLPNAQWVYWDLALPADTRLIHAGHFGKHDIYVDPGSLQNFMVWIVGATANTTGGGGKGGGSQKGAGAQVSLPAIAQ